MIVYNISHEINNTNTYEGRSGLLIKVCNAIMGSGKSSAAITYMNEHRDRKFIFITPFLEEAKRIRDECPDLNFVEPSSKVPKCKFTKIGHTESLISRGVNITTTHSAFKMYTKDMLDKIREFGYTLIIDENVDVLEEMEANPYDLQLAIDNGFIKEEEGEYRITDKEYKGVALKDGLLNIARTRNIIRVNEDDNTLYYWSLPADLISSFKDVFILTYMFECQSICYFLDMYKLMYEYIGVNKCEDGRYRFVDDISRMPEYVRDLASKIHILDNNRMNGIGKNKCDLSIGWFEKKSDCVIQLKNNISNCYKNIWDVPPSKRMWATFKSAEHKLKGKGYTKSFLVFNAKATNKYRDRTCLVYAVNVFMNVGVKLFYQRHDIKVNEDMYALSTMIQWIWRSAIRDGKDINIYIPSKRMRTLLVDWINTVSKEGVC